MRAWPLTAAVAALAACGGADLVLPDAGQPARLAALRGDRQSGTIGQPLPESLVVRVTDRFGDPVPAVQVSWTPGGGGSVSPASGITDLAGQAATQRRLGSQPGNHTTTAIASGLDDAPVTFTTTALAARLSLLTEPSASGSSGIALARQPVLQLAEPGGDPIARGDVAVTVQIASGGGTLSGETTAVSEGSGRVTFTGLLIRGAPGLRTLIFAAEGFTPVTSPPIAIGVGTAALIAATAGGDQAATVGSAVPVAPAVVVRDADGNLVGGVAVTFTVASGGGSVSGGAVITGDDGSATVGEWRLGTTAGSNTLRARAEGSGVTGNPVVFSATGRPGPLSASRSTVSAAPATIAASTGGSVAVVTVTAKDQFGNPLRDLAVSLAATGSGNTLTQPTGRSDAGGVATGRLSSTAAGAHLVSAKVGSTNLSQTTPVTVTAGPPSPPHSSADVGDGIAGSATAVAIQLRDVFGNPVGGSAGAISLVVRGSNSAIPTAAGAGGGSYTASYTPTRSGIDQVDVRVSGSALPDTPLLSQVVAGPADPSQTTAEITGGGDFIPMEITVSTADRFANPLQRGGDKVEVTVKDRGAVGMTDHGDGSYSGSYTPSALGTILIEIRLNGSPIAGSPFERTILFK